MSAIKIVTLGQSGLQVPAIGLGTMTFGEQVGAAEAFAIMDRALERGVNFFDTAEMYSVPPRAETYGATERIIGQYGKLDLSIPFLQKPFVRSELEEKIRKALG